LEAVRFGQSNAHEDEIRRCGLDLLERFVTVFRLVNGYALEMLTESLPEYIPIGPIVINEQYPQHRFASSPSH